MFDPKTIDKNTTLSDGKIFLRPHHPRDTGDLYHAVWESLKELEPWMPWAHPDYSIKETRQWLKTQPGEWKKGHTYGFAILDAKDGSYLGGCGIGIIPNAAGFANLGYWVRTKHAGQGIAPTAARLVAQWAFKELRLNRIEIVVAVDNARSLRVAEKMGAKQEGVLRNRFFLQGKPRDAVMFSLIRGEI